MSTARATRAEAAETARRHRLRCLEELQRKVLWLSSWTIHNANHLRPSRDGLKVGGHQASSASLATLMTALYFHVLRPEDRVAVKPHASPVFHAIQYLLGNQSRDKLEGFRALGGAQSYPSRTKDADDVDFSTGSVGLGVAMTSFASLVQDYVELKGLLPEGRRPGRMVALVGDAELDEGNVYEALLEGWKHDLRNVWWVIDYNRQSLDSVVTDRLFGQIDKLFDSMGWRVVALKYGKKLQAAFAEPGGEALRRWIDDCPNSLYSALVFSGAAAWRRHLLADLGGEPGIRALLERTGDAELEALMTNLAGHDLEAVLEAFESIDDDRPTCFIAYTIKGFGLPFAGHKDNHAGLMNVEQMAEFRRRNRIGDGEEWEPFTGLDLPAEELRAFLDSVPFNAEGRRRHKAEPVPLPADFPVPAGGTMSTQEGFGKILAELAREDTPLASRLVTTSPDVTVSTNLGGWVNRRGIFDRRPREDVFREEKVVSAQRWSMSPDGQHIELGIAENNLFTLLAALGLGHTLFGTRLLPIGTLYDPFIQRGLDALNYACYQDARFIVVATPSGITLAPEGGAHQSIATPLIGMAQDGLASFEPAYVDELAAILRWSFDYLQRDEAHPGHDALPGTDWLRDSKGGSVYLRLSTLPLAQPQRSLDAELSARIITGGYWLKPPAEGCELAIVYSGAVAGQALDAWEQLAEELPGAGLLAVTSADRLNAEWSASLQARQQGHPRAESHVEQLLAPLAADAVLVTVLDGHPATLGWLGSVRGHRVQALGVEHFGQSGDVPDLHRHYRIDAEAILDACAAGLVARCR
ncbi:pyruvate dehydrogenase E1 component [Tistlia consotensis]|uniref:Pyruvate dehydrogenase E1 component n=1 Tax=Tistlia consotensis USBA 355 TaxID=560819 RepID=A0A1Y6BQU9_9PROT|nr:transketolase [Tistlia consotensis]SMF24464.1 pyruvate dehydrogenase E1 component [Tistlia consotensis USBA 355]SNR60495.1 pyruvate dehydrogenase E1 component [Tistlia consotensis]